MNNEINEKDLHTDQRTLYDALIMRLGLMVKENVDLEQRVHQLVEDYNRVARQLRGEEKHELNKKGNVLRELTEALDKCEALEKDNSILKARLKEKKKAYNQAIAENETLRTENENGKIYMSAIDAFVAKAKLYVSRGTSCPYVPWHPAVSSTACLECGACLRVWDDLGVVCLKKLKEVEKRITTDE